MRKTGTWIAAALAGIVVVSIGGAYLASPYFAAKALADAAKAGNKDKLEALVDFPAVRDGLKSQLTAMLTAKMQNDPELKDNPFAGLGQMMVPALAERAVDAMVTPGGIAAMATAKPAAAPGQPDASKTELTPAPTSSQADDNTVHSYSYVTMDRFRASAAPKSKPAQHIDFVFERRNFFSWKLVKVALPEALLTPENAG
ncbi:hypothetical protein AEAC466_07705 [Asticcacaulis sp. AC466]|uniref:DUF2939 domain-containing protein n=1 Tax=Asticcacaulis sp. AC466 TaxID=1282362 RepID=UPI0003C408A7|nr:DUF2939 domain-containing protein [Asticcacaulis sp. AC466]ESQ84933.1 hypothetical protein AEAC466_07705 [Asticcacaulis sp. AC466]